MGSRSLRRPSSAPDPSASSSPQPPSPSRRREGTISLDDPIRKWITELPSYPVDPTIRRVVHHTSGLRDYLTLMSLRGLRGDDYYTNEEVRATIARQRELNFTPGSDYMYSNSGYFLLGEVIREATGMTLKEYAESRIFGPLGMRHSHFHDDHNHIVSDRATGYAPTEDGYRISVTTLNMVGDGGVFTSVEDLALWVDALTTDRVGPNLNAVLESTVPLTGGDPNPYAFGQRLGEYRGLRTVRHGGSFVGYRAAVARFPDGLSLEWLRIEKNSISDLGPLSGNTTLKFLWIGGNSVASLTPLSAATGLRQLFAQSNQISDLGPLAGMASLELLWMFGKQVSDVSVLSGLTQLDDIILTANPVADITPFGSMTWLRRLNDRSSRGCVCSVGPERGRWGTRW